MEYKCKNKHVFCSCHNDDNVKAKSTVADNFTTKCMEHSEPQCSPTIEGNESTVSAASDNNPESACDNTPQVSWAFLSNHTWHSPDIARKIDMTCSIFNIFQFNEHREDFGWEWRGSGRIESFEG